MRLGTQASTVCRLAALHVNVDEMPWGMGNVTRRDFAPAVLIVTVT